MPFFFYIIIPVAAAFAILNIIYGPRRAWQIWQRFGHMLGDLLARVVLTVFYFTIFVPFAIIARLTQDPLGLKRTEGPLWLPATDGSAGVDAVDAARRQF